MQAKVLGDGYAGCISNGLTMRNGETVAKLRYVRQNVETISGQHNDCRPALPLRTANVWSTDSYSAQVITRSISHVTYVFLWS